MGLASPIFTRASKPSSQLSGFRKIKIQSRSVNRRLLQQFLQILLPHCRPGMRAVSVRLFGNWQQYESSFLYLLDFLLGDPQFGRIDEVIGGVDEHHRSLNEAEFG